MPRPVAVHFLILAFAGPLLTHAEAAEDLARSLVETQGRGHLSIPDGRVGDDPNVASVWRPGPEIDRSPSTTPVWDAALSFGSSHVPIAHDPGMRPHRGCIGSWPSPGIPRRHAWLQIFLC